MREPSYHEKHRRIGIYALKEKKAAWKAAAVAAGYKSLNAWITRQLDLAVVRQDQDQGAANG